MASLAELKSNPYWRILCYGQFKSGKTAGAGTFPRCRILSLDPDGHETLINKELEEKYKYSANVVDVFIPTRINRNSRGIATNFNAYDQTCTYFDEAMKKPDTFDSWVLDSGTSLGAMAATKGIILLGTPEYGKMSKTQETALNKGMLLPKIQDFGAERSLLEQFIDMLLDTPKNVILLAHEKEMWEGEGNNARMIGIAPMFTGQSAEKVPMKFSEVYNLRAQKEGPNLKRYLQTTPDGVRACGSRIGVPNGTAWDYSALEAFRRTVVK